MNEHSESNQEFLVRWFENHYECSECGTTWDDEWSCMCNDRCPECDSEIEPTASTDLSRPLIEKDFESATKLFLNCHPGRTLEVSQEEAREYAEAMLEGGEYRLFEEELVVLPNVTITPVIRSLPAV